MATKVKTKTKAVAKTAKRVLYDDMGDPRKAAPEFLYNIGKNSFMLSIAVSKVYEENPEGFKDYVNKELITLATEEGSRLRIAGYHVHMGRMIVKFQIPMDKLKRISWTKFKELSLLMEKDIEADALDKLLIMAETKSFEDVKEYVKKIRTKGQVTERLVTITLRLLNDQANIFEEAIKVAKKRLPERPDGSEPTDSDALELICLEYQLNVAPKGAPTDKTLKTVAKHQKQMIDRKAQKAPAKTRIDKGTEKTKAVAKKKKRGAKK